ncbi:MAG: methyltransferase domain-containing protein [Methanocellales archaeon]
MILAFELSGEHKTLSRLEVLRFLAASGVKYREIVFSDQLLIIEVDFYPQETASRLGMVHCIVEVLGICKPDEQSIISLVDGLKLNLNEMSFCVRVKAKSQAIQLEKLLGEVIHKRGYRVDLENPQIIFRVILTNELAIFGRVLAAVKRGEFAKRKPKLKPFFYPGVLMPHIARALVNISGVKSGELLLDPFCGAGGILVEAGLAGARVIGSDFQSKMARGAKLNLDFYGANYYLLISDACNLPLKNKCIDAIVTDPPYGRSARIEARDIEDLYNRSLLEMHRVLKENKIAVVVSDRSIKSLAENAKFQVLEVIQQRVHKSLTRYIWVLKKSC